MLSYRFRTSASTRTRKTPSRWSLYFFNGLLAQEDDREWGAGSRMVSSENRPWSRSG